MICSDSDTCQTRDACSDKGGESRQWGAGPRLIVHHQLGPVQTHNRAVTVLEWGVELATEVKVDSESHTWSEDSVKLE